jgi:hypothetical protein
MNTFVKYVGKGVFLGLAVMLAPVLALGADDVVAVTSITPAPGTTNISLTGPFSITFNVPLAPASVNSTSIQFRRSYFDTPFQPEEVIPSTPILSDDGKMVSVVPELSLNYGRSYFFKIPGGPSSITNLAGQFPTDNILDSNFFDPNVGSVDYRFSTAANPGDTELPTVTAVSSDAVIYTLATLAPINVRVTFSEGIAKYPTITVEGTPQAVNSCSDNDVTTFCFSYTLPSVTSDNEIVISEAEDAAFNVMLSDNSHIISVQIDTLPPTIAPMADSIVDATSDTGTAVTYTLPTVTDDLSTGLTANCSPASGSNFSVGSTIVTCNVSDNAGNAAAATTFTIGVNAYVPPADTTAPMLATVTAVPTPSLDTTPEYTLSSTEAGTLTATGSCEVTSIPVSAGNTTIALGTLSAGTYNDCSLVVTDAANNPSAAHNIPTFIIESPSPAPAPAAPSSGGGGGQLSVGSSPIAIGFQIVTVAPSAPAPIVSAPTPQTIAVAPAQNANTQTPAPATTVETAPVLAQAETPILEPAPTDTPQPIVNGANTSQTASVGLAQISIPLWFWILLFGAALLGLITLSIKRLSYDHTS